MDIFIPNFDVDSIITEIKTASAAAAALKLNHVGL